MLCARPAVTAALAMALIALGAHAMRAETATPPTTTTQPAAPPATPPAISTQTATPPASPPAAAQPAPAAPSTAEPAPPIVPAPGPAARNRQSSDAFGEEVTLPARTVVELKGNGTWDNAFDTLTDSFKTLHEYLGREKIKPAGPPIAIYTSTDDTGFEYTVAVPIEAAPANPPHGDIEVGQSPSGKMLKFVHRGSYDEMDSTYEAITNYLDSKSLEAADSFIEEYVTDPLNTPEDKLVVNVYVPIK
jgi:effector-binding domain-containing protein